MGPLQAAAPGPLQAAAPTVGRRSLAGSTGKSPRLNFRVTRDLYDHATERAQREGKTLSEIARDALENYVR